MAISRVAKVFAPSRMFNRTRRFSYPKLLNVTCAANRESASTREGTCASTISTSRLEFLPTEPNCVDRDAMTADLAQRREVDATGLSAPSLRRTTAPIGRLPASLVTCFSASPKRVEGALRSQLIRRIQSIQTARRHDKVVLETSCLNL